VTDSSLAHLVLARLRLYWREPGTLFWGFGFPVLLSLALGVAFRNRPPDPVIAAVEAGPGAERVLAALSAGGEVRARETPSDEAQRALRSGRVALVVRPGDPALYLYDPTRPEGRLARRVVDDALQRASGRRDALAVSDVHVEEPGARYIDFLVPGLLGLNLMGAGLWGLGYAIVENRSRRLLKRLVATPMRRGEYLLSFMVTRLVFMAVEVPVLMGFARAAFGVTVRGSMPLFLGLCTLGATAFSGLGLLLGSRTRNTTTISGLINAVSMPMFVCSGVFFSIANFPEWLQPWLRLLPLTALNDALRAVMNEGAGLAAVAVPLVVLASVAALAFAAALKLFRWS